MCLFLFFWCISLFVLISHGPFDYLVNPIKRPKGQHQQLQTNQLAIKPIQTVHADHNEENVQDTRREPTSRIGRL